jgi:hypothetical protein
MARNLLRHRRARTWEQAKAMATVCAAKDPVAELEAEVAERDRQVRDEGREFYMVMTHDEECYPEH